MPCNESPQSSQIASARAHSVVLSPWVNERFPPWEHLLTARDVARLTRRPHWILTTLVILGRFPRKQRFHGRGIGWLQSDVLAWLAKDLSIAPYCAGRATEIGARAPRQRVLPLRFHRSGYPCRSRLQRVTSATAVRRREQP